MFAKKIRPVGGSQITRAEQREDEVKEGFRTSVKGPGPTKAKQRVG